MAGVKVRVEDIRNEGLPVTTLRELPGKPALVNKGPNTAARAEGPTAITLDAERKPLDNTREPVGPCKRHFGKRRRLFVPHVLEPLALSRAKVALQDRVYHQERRCSTLPGRSQ